MKRAIIFLLFCCVLAAMPFLSLAQNKVAFKSEPSQAIRKELEEAEAKMFDGIMRLDPAYFKNNVAADYITINADGIMANKEETLADSARKKVFEGFKNATTRLLDKRIRVYGPVGIITGRSQVLMNDALMIEFLYTAIWVKEKGTWLYTGWQGTISKNSPASPVSKTSNSFSLPQ